MLHSSKFLTKLEIEGWFNSKIRVFSRNIFGTERIKIKHFKHFCVFKLETYFLIRRLAQKNRIIIQYNF